MPITDYSSYTTPKYKIGDLIEFELSYALVVFKIEHITKSKHGIFYELKGVSILRDSGTNKFMTEYRSYQPYCEYVDTHPSTKLYFNFTNDELDEVKRLEEQSDELNSLIKNS